MKFKMEAFEFLANSECCRLCGQENKNGIDLFAGDENGEDLCYLINRYLPITVKNEDIYPRTICPGCHIQLEATKLFMDLILEGQEKIRNLLQTQKDLVNREEKERLRLEQVLQNHNPKASVETYTIQTDENGEKYIIQIYSDGPLFSPDHQLSMKAMGLSKPKRKRGRPPKTATDGVDDLTSGIKDSAQNSACLRVSPELLEPQPDPSPVQDLNIRRKRKIRPPVRYQGAVQGKELARILKKEGVIDETNEVPDDGESGKVERGFEPKHKNDIPKTVIGKMVEADGEAQVEQLVFMKTKTPVKNVKKKGSVKRKFSCDICKKEFQHLGRLETHRRTHKIKYSCQYPDCSVQDENRALIEAHQEEAGHEGISAFEQININGIEVLPNGCELPDKIAIESPSEDRSLKCEKCDKSFSCKQNYEVHMKAIHEGEKPFECKTCKKTFAYACSLKNHQLIHRSDNEPTTGEKGFKCDVCEKIFQHPSSLLYHKDTEHSNRKFICNKCNKSFKHRQLLSRHQLVHSEERPFKCTHCHRQFKSKTNLTNHENIHKGIKPFECPICNSLFLYRTSLWVHLKWHNGTKPYQCDVCKKSFSQKGNLLEHQRIHTGEKPFKCSLCGRNFTTSSQCRLHMKRHTGEKPFACKYCKKKFLHKETYETHIRRHLGQRPFNCRYCAKAFPEQWACTRHERIHQGLKNYKCPICSKAFTDSANLWKHKKIHLKNGIKLESLDKKPQEVVADQAVDSQIANVNIQLLPGPQEDDKKDDPALANSSELQIHDLLDHEGNAISITTADGQPVPIISSGNENFQGLLPDGTLVSFDIVPGDQAKSLEEKGEEEPAQIPASEVNLLSTDIEFLEGNSITTTSETLSVEKPAFLSEDGKVCFITSFGENSFLTMN